MSRTFTVALMLAAAASLTRVAPVLAQVGKSQGVVDANTVAEAELVKLPHMTAAIAKAIVGARPFDSIVDLNKLLLAQGLTPEQAAAFYGKAFVHINLNT